MHIGGPPFVIVDCEEQVIAPLGSVMEVGIGG